MNGKDNIHTSFIGKDLRVISAANNTYENVFGKIVDETKNSFIVKTERSNKVVLKNKTIFEIDDVTITGDSIKGRPDQRIRKK